MRSLNFRTLDLNLLRVFDQVMAERNLTRAARNLHMTQPAVSNALGRLRDQLGDPLFIRTPGGLGASVGSNSVNLSWQDSGPSEAVYEIERSVDGGPFDIHLDTRWLINKRGVGKTHSENEASA